MKGRPRGTKAGIDWAVQGLGEESDADIARRLGVCATAVWRQRVARQIPPFGINWDIQPLGIEGDASIARRLGVCAGSVAQQRRKRQIRPHMDRAARVKWDRVDPMIGTMSDAAVASVFGISPAAVSQRRPVIGLPPSRVMRHDFWRWIPLGTYFDCVLADMIGETPIAVFDARRRRGISPYSERRKCMCGASYVAYRDCARFCSRACANRWRVCVERGDGWLIAGLEMTISRAARLIKSAESAGIHSPTVDKK